MKVLIVDTSLGLQAIYYDSKTDKQVRINEEKSKLSSIFHVKLDELVKNNNISWDQVDYYIYNLGPGSYTGLKIAKGLAQSLSLTKTKTLGFHEFELPAILGNNQGVWIDNAFKNQYFIYEWDQENKSHYLLNKTDFFFSENKEYFAKEKEDWNNAGIVSTRELLNSNAPKIIEYVINSKIVNEEIFYYRTIDMEYQRS